MKLPADYETDTVTRLDTNLDDLSPEITGAVMEKLLGAGALDVWLTPAQMKKNRPGVQLSLLCAEEAVERLAEIIFTETSAFGLRMHQVVRLKLERRFETVRTAFGEVTVKLGLRAGKVLQIAPEFESCRAASEKSGQPLRTIYEAATRSYRG
jgi:pyridinium-3,5-bisthiocarboxylic acid mononucleotide nickel chelatase